MKMLQRGKKSGFTLIEVLLVVAIIAILAGIVIIALNPYKQLADTKNSQRWMDVNSIINAVYQYAIDHNGVFPASITTTETTICKTGASSCSGLINLSALVPDYVISMPVDPTCTSANGTCYTVERGSDNRITVKAPDAQQGRTIEVRR